MHGPSKRTPKDVTDFEREQLRFFLGQRDVAATLVALNPSLAWLPVLSQLQLISADTQLGGWIAKNMSDPDAVREVAANIHFFSPETANVLDFRLNQTAELPAVLMTCWRLLIRNMRTAKQGFLRNEWFDIEPRIRAGEHSPEVLERLAQALRPKPQVGKRPSWYGDTAAHPPEHVTDLIAVDYEIEEGISDAEVLAALPESTAADIDAKLLGRLTDALHSAVEDALAVGVESDRGWSASDADVPSVAEHKQNALRTGFLPIVRVAADLWTRLARKDTKRARDFVELWRASPVRLIRRLALFAAADGGVSPEAAAHTLLTLPAGELFLTNSSVEVFRLIAARWRDFTPNQRKAIEKRIATGPPADWFTRDNQEMVDRSRFDVLGHMTGSGIQLGAEAQSVLDEIRVRWPKWRLRPQEQAGFHMWSESSSGSVGDPAKLTDVSDGDLVEAAKRASDKADFLEGDAWQGLCQTDLPRALRGLAAQAATGQWPTWAWHHFLWAAQKLPDPESVTQIAQMLIAWSDEAFTDIAADASWWLNHVVKALDERLLWSLWDRIAKALDQQDDEVARDNAFTASLNHPAGRLAEVLLKRLTKGEGEYELPEVVRERLDKLISAGGKFGFLARIRLAAEVSLLFERAPEWTKEKIIPLFEWASPDAAAMWSARRYANYIGSSALFGLTKQSFLELFARSDVSDESLRTFADWLAVVMIANRSDQAGYPITPAEARSALRRAGVKSLASIGHRLAISMEAAKPDEKLNTWRDVIGPVFQSVWPLDVELQTSASTFKLVQILRASGAAFPEAAEKIIPFIQPDDPHRHTSVYSISDADDLLYSSSPERMLDLVAAVVGEAPAQTPYRLSKALERIRTHAPNLADTKKFQKLMTVASPA